MLKGGIQNYIFDNTTKLHEVKLTSDFQKQGKYKVFRKRLEANVVLLDLWKCTVCKHKISDTKGDSDILKYDTFTLYSILVICAFQMKSWAAEVTPIYQ